MRLRRARNGVSAETVVRVWQVRRRMLCVVREFATHQRPPEEDRSESERAVDGVPE